MFLEDSEFSPRPLKSGFKDLQPIEYYIGQGTNALEIVILESKKVPTKLVIQNAYIKIRSGRATPILIVIKYDDQFFLCGPTGEQPDVVNTKDLEFVKRISKFALRKGNRNMAINFVMDCFATFESNLPGIINQGLLTNHELSHGTKKRNDWENASNNSQNVIGKINNDLLISLGFTNKPLDNLTNLLSDKDGRTAIAVLLKDNEAPELNQERFNNLSPISYALTKADKERLPWVIFIQEDKIRLYSTQNIGVGRRGRTESYIQCQTSMLSKSNQALLWLIFSSKALKKDGTIDEILSDSKRFASDIAEKLRERIYDTVVPELAMGIVKAQNLKKPTSDSIQLIYEMTLTILFRLLFIAYAEDRDFLPYKTNEIYRTRSLKNKAIELSRNSSNKILEPNISNHWSETILLFEAIYKGNKEWGIPTYDGTMFSNKESVSKAGAEISKLTLPNSCFETVLKSLLLDYVNNENLLPVDFRSLSVREFGTIYEGLLESELSLAKQNLTVDRNGNYRPAKNKEKIDINLGEIYLHNKSGARKSSASFYTKDFAVEFLLDGALEKALDEHLQRMRDLDQAERVEQFFNFYVADISMGSGHFLIAAIDRIERRFALWLDENKTPGIHREIQNLRVAAYNELGELGETLTIDDGQLLRRLIAKRCIYGVDLNPIAVQLARLSVWIHTFVPGLPLSLLDHNLAHGNSLIGICSIDEIESELKKISLPLFPVDSETLLGKAKEPLEKLAKLSEANVKDIKHGRDLINEARFNVKDTEALCNLLIAKSVSKEPELQEFNFQAWEKEKAQIQNSTALKLAVKILEPLKPIHFPIAFPQVFLNKSDGFNVIIGNPPWEEAVINEDKFWGRYNPGFSGLSPREQKIAKERLRNSRPDLISEYKDEVFKNQQIREFLHLGNFPGMSTGDPDLYKAFIWRFWFLTNKNYGQIGVVIPRSVFVQKGSEKFRKEIFNKANIVDVCILLNSKGWVFKDIHKQTFIALTVIARSVKNENKISIIGPIDSLENFFKINNKIKIRFDLQELLNWSLDASLPLLSNNEAVEVFRQIKKTPRLDFKKESQWRARADSEMHATSQKPLMDLDSEICPKGYWPVYKGESFKLWNPDTGLINSFADPEKVLKWLQNKRLKSHQSKRDSVHKEFSFEYINNNETLSCLKPRIVFRDVTNSIDHRTVHACLIPPKTFVTNTAPTILFPRGDSKDEAFLLGILCSIPLDWCARRFVGLHLNLYIFNSLPIPRPKRTNILWERVVKISGRLASCDERYKDWANEVGVEYGPIDEESKQEKIYELDALAAHLYELSENQLTLIFKTFRKNWNYNDRLNKVLHYYKIWKNKF